MSDESWKNAATIYEFTVKDLDQQDVSLEKYRGHPLIVVNVAAKCGLMENNYKQFNELYDQYRDKGLRILAFPCNQFGNQEPGCSVDIKEFTAKKKVEFDMFDKIDVNGNDAIPLYKWLKLKQKGTLTNDIKWNFSKFLINKEGVAINRYSSTTEPKSFIKDIEAEL